MSADLLAELPTIVFVMGKGGVGRSSVSAALALALARRGQRVLIMEWTATETLGPWFGLAPAAPNGSDWKWMPAPRSLAPNVSIFNYRLQEALRGYFVDHLGLKFFYSKVVDGPHWRRLIEAAPGIAEMMFIGQLWWMTELAHDEAGFSFDRIVVDAPATGHGASLLDLPATLSTIGATGLLALEVGRLLKMMADPRRVGTVAVALPEELACEETVELVPRLAKELRRPPLAVLINRSVAGLVDPSGGPLLPGAPLPPEVREGLETVHAELQGRLRLEAKLREALSGATTQGIFALREQMALRGARAPREVVADLSAELEAQWRGAA